MAPLDTSTRPGRVASEETRASRRATSRPPAAVVSEDEPTLTTSRCASAMAARVTGGTLFVVLKRDSEPLGAAQVLLDATLLRTGAALVLEAHVLPAHAGRELLEQRGLPVEHDLADGHLDAGRRAQVGELLLDPEAGQPVGEVADGLVVVEVGLLDPALGLGAGDDVDLVLQVNVEPEVVDRGRTQDDAGGLLDRLGGPPGGDLPARANASSLRPRWETALTVNTW